MKIFILIIFLLVPSVTQADSSRSRTIFTSENDKYELVLTNKHEVFNGDTANEKWSLINKSTKKKLYQIDEHLWSKIALISNDGLSVVAIDDYSLQEYEDNPEVLSFYHNGKKTKSYKLYDLYDNKILALVTVSHFQWSKFYEETSKIEKSKFKLTTYDLNHFTFEVRTGEILKKERDKVLTKDSIFAFGDIKKIDKNLYEMTFECVIFGNIPKDGKIQFVSELKFYNEYRFPLILRNGKYIPNKNFSRVNVCESK